MKKFMQFLEEANRQETIDKLKDHLASGSTAHITFKKADGSETTRHATLNPEHINQAGGEGAKSEGGKAQSTTAMRFFSIDDNGWRSFNHDRLVGWRPHLGAVTHKPKE
jgi:hypothetical protein